jgi:hypothetical protein
LTLDESQRPGARLRARAWLRSPVAPALVAGALGVIAAIVFFRADLTLSHYDARAHLVVARRVYDSLRPGWRQLGAVWLPLPHLLNLLPVQDDWLYRTGLSAVAMSVASFALGAAACWQIIFRATGSAAAAWAGFAVMASQPDTLYLQSTPMTEPLMMGLCLGAVAATMQWVEDGGRRVPWMAGALLALACLTRYDSWPITGATLVLSAVALGRLNVPPARVLGRVALLAICPIAALCAFFWMSHITVGSWFVSGGFFEPDLMLFHQPKAIFGVLVSGVRQVNGSAATLLGGVAAAIAITRVARDRERAAVLVAFALAACAALPAYAFWAGHPVRVRYMVPFTMPLAVMTGLGVGFAPRRVRALAIAAVLAAALIETPPFPRESPMVREAQRDAASRAARAQVTQCLAENYDNTPILASMGSLAPYMQDTSRAGFALRQYIHEGTGQLWQDSLETPDRHAGWLLIDEDNAFRDALIRRRDEVPGFLDGFTRVCDGGGLVLYRRITQP